MQEFNIKDSYSSNDIIRVLYVILHFVNGDDFQSLNELNEVSVDNINNRIAIVLGRLRDLNCESVVFDSAKISPKRLHHDWLNFSAEFSGNMSDDIKNKYKRLLKSTLQFLEYIKSSPKENFIWENKEEAITGKVRTKSLDEENARLEQLQKRRKEIRQQYEQAMQENPNNQDMIQQLKRKLETMRGAVLESRKTIESIKTDADEERHIIDRIDKSFEELKKVKNLDNELWKLKWEYYVCLFLLSVVIIVFLGFYIWFLCNIKYLQLKDWYEYLPYSMSVAITIGLLWLLVYLKNRASKISIEMSSQLYDIHYIEGLLKLTNSISRSSNEAMDNIERMANTIVESFIEKLKLRNLEEKELAKMEKQELKDSPYWKFMQELKELLKTVKK